MTTFIKIVFSEIVLITALSACSSTTDKKTEETAVAVETYLPTASQEDGFFVSGMVSAKQTAMISTRVMGFIDKVYVKQGDAVRQGQLLLVVNGDDLKAKKAQAEAMMAEAEAAAKNANRDYERYKALYDRKSVSQKELENMELNRTSVNAKLQMARQARNEVNAMLAYTDIRAPFSGIITQRMIDEGSTAAPGMPLLSIEQSGEPEIKASVPENYVAYIKVGSSVKVDIKSLGKRLDGKISEISPSSALSGGQYAIKVAIAPEEKENLRSGMYAGIYIPGETGGRGMKSVWIDAASIVRRDQLTGVYVATSDSYALLRWVRLGKEIDGQVEALSGLKAEDRIIRRAEGKLYNGKKISVQK
ncbi:RND family efflux transporter MFP subunit [Bacteroides zoogleoformans]|uniref:Efflux RND transporter periplasmic adaptor subunit n=1 Tax=Bacteroides zoogleoformans TaxID=28119 RepID=A0ABM6T9N6_9BACE|nr:efflux RND transporter periplasmic adaptor subunit [Bacteroides zoogleoformans]AVM53587.1 efflux RND transporter periplasmic adaptor subunit [Bacteroides zoogleoformans]TWJ13584.1 RND family efflux transporter MFP subunit [Bacteroides zoogleoformans]